MVIVDEMKLFKSKLVDILCVLAVLVLIAPAPVSMRKIKWFAYCYFDIVFGSLSCGKCTEEIMDRIRVGELDGGGVDETVNSNNTNNTARIINATITTKKFIDSYCSYFRSTAESSLNQHEAIRLSNERDVNVMPLLPVLTHDWYNYDLLYLIEKNEVSTNLENLTYFARIPETLRKIELIDFGIGAINFNAFRNFPQLQVIRLRNNNLNTVELSSFLTWTDDDQSSYAGDDEDENSSSNTSGDDENMSSSNEHNSNKLADSSGSRGSQQGKLIELDLSANKLYNIKLENFVYLKSLRVLNLSNNYIRHFDLHFLSVVMPHLQVLDLSNNQIKRLRVIDNRVYFTSPSSSIDTTTNNTINAPPSSTSYISLATTLILNELVYLNLERNALSQLDHLFSISFPLIDDARFCNLSNSLVAAASPSNKRPTLDINMRNNRWKCDCKTYELIDSLKSLLHTSNQAENTSCYLNYLVRENSYIFASILNFTDNNLNCFRQKISYSWPSWYEEKCHSNNNSGWPFGVAKSNQTQTSTKISNHPPVISFKLNSLYSFGSAQNSRNSLTTRMSLLKYDITNLFYWISSICLSVVTISCLLLAWYYCWKRYQGQSATAVAAAANATAAVLSSSSGNMQSAAAAAASYSHSRRQRGDLVHAAMSHHHHFTAPATTRRTSDVYLLNSRLNRVTSPSSSGVPSYLYQISLNRNTREEIRDDRIRNGMTTNATNGRHNGGSSLYYISLNPDSAFSGGAGVGGGGGSNGGAAFINVGYQSSANRGGGDLDEPPNYYEAILVSSSTGVSTSATTTTTTTSESNPTSTNRGSGGGNTTSIVTRPATSGVNSLNKSSHLSSSSSPSHRQMNAVAATTTGVSEDSTSTSSSSSTESTASSNQPQQETIADDVDIITTTQTTTVEMVTNQEDNTTTASTTHDRTPITNGGVDFLNDDDITLNDDEEEEDEGDSATIGENTSTTFFIDRNLIGSRRGHSTDV